MWKRVCNECCEVLSDVHPGESSLQKNCCWWMMFWLSCHLTLKMTAVQVVFKHQSPTMVFLKTTLTWTITQDNWYSWVQTIYQSFFLFTNEKAKIAFDYSWGWKGKNKTKDYYTSLRNFLKQSLTFGMILISNFVDNSSHCWSGDRCPHNFSSFCINLCSIELTMPWGRNTMHRLFRLQPKQGCASHQISGHHCFMVTWTRSLKCSPSLIRYTTESNNCNNWN